MSGSPLVSNPRPREAAGQGEVRPRRRWWRNEPLPDEVEERVQRQIAAIARVTLRVRMWISVVGCMLALLNWSSNAFWTMVGTLACGVGYGVAAYALLRARIHRAWAVVTLDSFLLFTFSLTSLPNKSGAYEVLLAPHYVVMALLLMLLAALHFDVRVALWAGACAAALRLATFLALAVSGEVALVHQAVYGERAVGIADQLTIVALYAGFGALVGVVTHFSRALLVRTTHAAIRAAVLEQAQASFRRYLGEAVLRDVAAGVEDTLFARSLDGVVVVGATGRVLAANAAAERLFGRSPLVDHTFVDVVPSGVADGLAQHVARGRTRADRHEFSVEAEPPHDIESRATAMHDGAVLLTLRDVTERRRFEQGLVRAARMESVGHLAGGIAHDFNNLLTGLSGHLSLLRVEQASESGVQLRVDKMEAIVTRAAGMARRLLVLGRGGTTRGPVEIEAVIAAAVDLVRGSFPNDVTLAVEVAPDLPPLHASARELEACFVNLLFNARDACEPRGAVRIGARAYGDGYVEIVVDDDGPGIPVADRLRVFEPFFSTKSRTGGTGLGLAVVARVVREHEGTVEVASDRENGTRMIVRLPVAGAVEGVQERARTPATRARRVHVVDDEEAVRESVSALLSLAGYLVTSSASAEDAWEALASGPPPDALVSDVVMPGEDGLSFAARVVARHPAVGVVVMTGFSTDLQRCSRVRDGTWACLPKPFRAVELLDVVGRAMSAGALTVDGPRSDR